MRLQEAQKPHRMPPAANLPPAARPVAPTYEKNASAAGAGCHVRCGLRHCIPRSLTQVIPQPRHTMAATNKCLARRLGRYSVSYLKAVPDRSAPKWRSADKRCVDLQLEARCQRSPNYQRTSSVRRGMSERCTGSRSRLAAVRPFPNWVGSKADLALLPAVRDLLLLHRIEQLDLRRSPTMAAQSDIEWDVVIVGSGFAGALIANELGKAHKKVLVLEAGAGVPPTLTPT